MKFRNGRRAFRLTRALDPPRSAKAQSCKREAQIWMRASPMLLITARNPVLAGRGFVLRAFLVHLHLLGATQTPRRGGAGRDRARGVSTRPDTILPVSAFGLGRIDDISSTLVMIVGLRESL